MPIAFEKQATAFLPHAVIQNTPPFLFTPTGLFVVVLFLGYYVMPMIAWIFPLIAAVVGFIFGIYTVPSWIPTVLGGLGSVYSVKVYRETGSQRWGLLRWLFIPATIGALINISDLGDVINVDFDLI